MTTTNNARRKVRWIIAHFPQELFVRAAKAFQIELEKLCPGQFEIEIHTVPSYKKQYADLYTKEELEFLSITTPKIANLEDPNQTTNDTKPADTFMGIKPYWNTFFQALKDGKFEMSQTQMNIVGSHLDSAYHAIDLPFLWENHDHVSQAMDGEIGEKLSSGVAERTGLRSLGFTYSGGYRIIGSTEGITSLSQLNDKKFITFTRPSSFLFKNVGIKHVARGKVTTDDIADISEQGGAIETTYLRFAGKNVLKTNHSMFMTTILTSDSFLASLTEEQREAFKEAAHRVAKIERLWSVEDAAKYEIEAVAKGVTINEIKPSDEKLLRAAAQKVYQEKNLVEMGIDASIVEEIIELGKNI